jgi:hypothetical protein
MNAAFLHVVKQSCSFKSTDNMLIVDQSSLIEVLICVLFKLHVRHDHADRANLKLRMCLGEDRYGPYEGDTVLREGGTITRTVSQKSS